MIPEVRLIGTEWPPRVDAHIITNGFVIEVSVVRNEAGQRMLVIETQDRQKK
jgi:hypothetical protein